MTTFRMGGAPGALCPTCSYSHFPFCMRPPPGAAALPSPPMPGSFPTQLPSIHSLGRPPMHSPQLPPHFPLLRPPAMTSYQPSPPLRQAFPGRGALGDVIPNGGVVPPIARGASALNSNSVQFGGPSFDNQPSEPFESPFPAHLSMPRLATSPNLILPSGEHFPGPLNLPTLAGSPHNGLLANPRPPPPSNAWPEDNERDYLLRERSPTMPQWFLDQQRRVGSKGGPPNGRNGIGELLRGEEIVSGSFFGSHAPGPRGMNPGRLERDPRQRGFEGEDLQEAQQSGSWFADRDGPGSFHGVDMSGNRDLPDVGMERKTGPSGLLENFEGIREGAGDRERRIWGMDAPRDPSINEQGFSLHNSGHADYAPAPSFGRDGSVAGGPNYQLEMRGRADEGIWSQQSSREVTLLHEHGLVNDSVQSKMTSGITPLADAAGERWEKLGAVPGRGHFSREGLDGTAQRRLHTEGEHMRSVSGKERAGLHHNLQQARPGHPETLHGAGNLLPPERSLVNGERPYIENSGSGVGVRGPPTNVDGSQYGVQVDHRPATPPVQEELDELYYLKHFPQPSDNQSTSAHPSAAPPLHPNVLPNPARMRNDGPPFHEKLPSVASHSWENGQRAAGLQSTDRLQQQSDRGHPQQPLLPHANDPSPPQGHGQQHSLPPARSTFQQGAQLPPQSYPQHEATALSFHHQPFDVSMQPPATLSSLPQQVSNSQLIVRPSPMEQQHRRQPEHLHLPPHLMQPQLSHLAHHHIHPLPPNQGPPPPHQMQQQGQGGQAHRFFHSPQAMHQSFGNEEALMNGRTNELLPRTSQAPIRPSVVHQHPVQSHEAPPLPLHAADAPPPPPPSPPHCQPPLLNPHTAPLPPPHPPPLPPSPPPPVQSSGLTHVPFVALSAPFPGHPHPLNLEDPLHRLNYNHSTHSLPQSLPGVPQGPGFQPMGPRYMHQFGEFRNHGQLFPIIPQQQEKPKVVDAVSIFRRPGRLTRPDRIVVILRGLPGSGKSYLAKALRDVELMNGGTAPRIHSIDDYFMTEVEKVEGEDAGLTTGSSVRSKKRVIKKVMEYCYEPEMEEVYRGSMFKAFRKTLEEGMFSFIIVDDRNVLVADFAQFWAIAKRSGYEVYLLEPSYKDPAGCAARNVHDFKQDQIHDMATRWEPAPPMYLQLDVSSLFRGDDLNAQDITEVEMDTDDMEREGDQQEEEYRPKEHRLPPSEQLEENDSKPATPGDRWEDSDGEVEEPVKPAKRMRASEAASSDSSGSSGAQGPGNNALSGLMQAYGKRDKSVHWADSQDEARLSIGATVDKISDLVIGPGPGYNKASNPLRAEELMLHTENEHLNQSRKFLEQYRAEQDAFKAVFASRRQRGAGLDDEDA